jgi:hypothetical protein
MEPPEFITPARLSDLSFKKRYLYYKRSTRFYFQHQHPLTIMESQDLKQSKRLHTFFTMGCSCLLVFASLRIRTQKNLMTDVHDQIKNPFISNIFNDLILAAFGYTAANLFMCKRVYDSREYTRERMAIEKETQFDRKKEAAKG